jgi:hypothetical protein
MKRYAKIRYAFRPRNYWDDQDVLRSLLRNVKGTQRRSMITDYWKQGRLPEIEDELLKDTLSEESRERLGQIHPSFMGGEYLPDYRLGEVEIVRIELESTTSDVISIRAARDPEGIRYRIVDEYEGQYEFGQPFETSPLPLSLKQLIGFIEGSNQEGFDNLAICHNEINNERMSREELRHFTSVSSEFYPQLYEHFEHVYEDWVRAEKIKTPKR